ncbi:hypothetical protein PHLCEN_2v11266 [Hermanssonia centrifuga]|uniref:FAD/NAD(P)-binding domain-containing protein n=1 Tax=Hermanssonia centrifuga TaxID=98765 RepID=A0A2R6NKJ7_9APHY|nr:hypothetical protein PHLCEN_2v11266 [Hermanssonia centrifuga]
MELDAVVLGTGLSESIVAAALSKAGYKIAHVDINPYYGGDEASLTLDELLQWAKERAESSVDSDSAYLSSQRERFTNISYTGSLPLQSRQYAVSLLPMLVPSAGPTIDSLIASGVSRYGGFKLLEKVALFDSPGVVKPVPGNKEDVFKNKQLSLLGKRRLMRFLMFAGGEFEDKPELQGSEQMPFTDFLKDKFSLKEEAVQAIAYALAFCALASDPTLPALERIRRYLRSSGRYGPSPFLVGHYGGAGEIAQGFCRTAAVAGATYVLGRQVSSIVTAPIAEKTTGKYTLNLEDLSEQLRCDLLISSPDHLPLDLQGDSSITTASTNCSFARCIAVIDRPVSFSTSESLEGSGGEDPASDMPIQDLSVDTALLVFSPSSIPIGSSTVAVNVLITGEGSMSAPRGRWILYITMPLLGDQSGGSHSPEELLRPYLDATLSLTRTSEHPESALPLVTLFYEQSPREGPENNSTEASLMLSTPPHSRYLPEVADSAARNAEVTFWRALEVLKSAGRLPGDKNSEEAVENFWPPLEYVNGEDDEW